MSNAAVAAAAASADIGVSAATLEALEHDFDDVIRDLGGEDNLERFRLEYEKLHRALKKSHDSERKLVKKCQELSQEIMANAAKVQSVVKMSQEDHNTIESLKKEIEKGWKMVDNAHEKEIRAKETIQQLKKEAAHLSALIEKGAALTQGQEQSLAELTEAKKDLVRERDQLSTKIGQQIHEIRDLTATQQKSDADVTATEEELKRIITRLADVKRDLERESKTKERADGQVRELTQVLQTRNAEIDARSQTLRTRTEAVEKLEQVVAEEAKKKADLTYRHSLAKKQNEASKQAIDEGIEREAVLTREIGHAEADVKQKDDDISALRHEEAKLLKHKDLKAKAVRKLVQEKDDIKKEHDMLERHIHSLKKQGVSFDRERKLQLQAQEAVERDIAAVDKRAQTEQGKQKRILSAIDAVCEQRSVLEEELEKQVKANNDLRQQVATLETERSRFATLSSEASVKHQQALKDAKIARMRGDDLQKQIEETSRQLVAQQVKYEQVRSDRNMYSKNVIEAQDEISEMKQKFKIMDHQIDQLKEELSMKEKKHYEAVTNHKVLHEKLSKLRKKINALMEQYEDAKGRSEGLSQEIKQLTKVINTCDVELAEQQKHFLSVTSERDILGTQLIRRNDELALLYEKIRIQQATLSKGEVQYRDRVSDIRMLRLKIAELKRQVHMAQVRVKNIDELKGQTTTLTRQLALERTKVQALSEELENPQNYLRWRKLEGTDLKPVEKERRIQALQKRVISVTEQVVEKDIIIAEKEKLYVELKAILARQPGPEVAEQLNVYQQDLRGRNTQMKCVAGELNMSASQSAEYKYEVERLHRELQEAKKQYFEMKMNHQTLLRDRSDTTGPGRNAATI